MTPHGITRTLQSEVRTTSERLRVFVVEESALDLFWMEMVFKSSRLPYTLEVATDAQAALQYLERHADTHRPDLIFLNAFHLLERFPALALDPCFILTNSASATERETFGNRVLPKPFTHEKLFDCLVIAELNAWATLRR